jgi:hypothetical protein
MQDNTNNKNTNRQEQDSRQEKCIDINFDEIKDIDDIREINDDVLRNQFNFSDEAIALKNEIIKDIDTLKTRSDKLLEEYDNLDKLSETIKSKTNRLAEMTGSKAELRAVERQAVAEVNRNSTRTVVFVFGQRKIQFTLSLANLYRIRKSGMWIGLAFVYVGIMKLTGSSLNGPISSIFTNLMYIMLVISELRLGYGIGEAIYSNNNIESRQN